MHIYLDMVVLLNIMVDFLLLLGTNRLSGFPTNGKRITGAALLGGLYSGACLLPGFRFLGNGLWRLVSLAAMGSLAFGWNRGTLKRCCVFILLSLALGGMALGMGKSSFPTIVLSAGGIWALCHVACDGCAGEKTYVPLEITYGDKTVKLLALRDTGNTLRDPITGEQVLILSAQMAGKITGLTEYQLRHPLETLAQHPLPGLRLIPYHSVGQGGGMMLAMRFDHMKIGSKGLSAVVAFAPEGLGKGEVYQALTGGMV